MKNLITKLSVLILVAFVFGFSNSFAQDKPETNEKAKKECCMKKEAHKCGAECKDGCKMKDKKCCTDKKKEAKKCCTTDKEKMKKCCGSKANKHDDHGHNHDAHGHNHGDAHQSHGKENIVRKGEVDLKAIDKNNDGKVYQDQMCWNVVSDEAGRCPLCEMKLKEVALETAKKNLVKHGHKVKK